MAKFKDKTIFICCSMIPHQTPPFFWLNNSQKLSESFPVIYVELPATSLSAGVRQTLKYCQWLFQLAVNPRNFTIWNFNFPLSHQILNLYLTYLKKFKGYQVISITSLPETFPIYKSIPADLSWFDCTDQYSKTEFIDNKKNIKKFDQIFSNSSLLFNSLQEINPKVKRISSGYYLNLSAKKSPSVSKINKSIVFSGGISHRIDYSLLIELAKLLPDYQFYFIGEVYLHKYYTTPKDKHCFDQWQQLLKLVNVHYLGAFSPDQSIRILSLFCVGIIPYDINDDMNYYSHPIKIYEYLAAGLPIVSTSMPSVVEYVNLAPVYIYDSALGTSKLIKKIFSSKSSPFKDVASIQKILDSQSIETKVMQIIKSIPLTP